MGGLLLRRREIMLKSAPIVETWDYEWYYTDGLPDANGATKVASTGSATMTNDGLKLKADLGYIAYRFPQYQTQIGTIEVEFVPYFTSTTGPNLRLCYSNGTRGGQTHSNPDGIRDFDDTSATYPITMGAACVERISIALSSWSCYVNGNTFLTGEPLSGSYANNTQVMFQNGGSDGTVLLRSIKIRKS